MANRGDSRFLVVKSHSRLFLGYFINTVESLGMTYCKRDSTVFGFLTKRYVVFTDTIPFFFTDSLLYSTVQYQLSRSLPSVKGHQRILTASVESVTRCHHAISPNQADIL